MKVLTTPQNISNHVSHKIKPSNFCVAHTKNINLITPMFLTLKKKAQKGTTNKITLITIIFDVTFEPFFFHSFYMLLLLHTAVPHNLVKIKCDMFVWCL